MSPTNPPSPTLSQSSTFVASTISKSKSSSETTYIFKRIPSRVALSLLSPILFLCGISLTVAASLIADKLGSHITSIQRLAIFLQILNYLVVAAAAVIGIVAAVRKSYRATQLFSGLLIGQIPFGIASGIIVIYMIFKATSRALSSATTTATTAASSVPSSVSEAAQTALASRDEAASAAADAGGLAGNALVGHACTALGSEGLTWMCEKKELLKGLMITTFIILWVFEIVSIYAGSRYSKQLAEAQMIKVVDEDEYYGEA